MGLNIGVLGLSMQVYGRVNKYVINMLGKAVMAEQTEKDRLNLLPRSYWSRYYVECDIAVSTNVNMCREYPFFSSKRSVICFACPHPSVPFMNL